MSNRSTSSLLITIICGLILFLTISPLLTTGFTNADDVESLTTTYKLLDVLTISHAGGRLSYYFSVTFGHLRTLSDSFAYLKFFYVAPVIALILASTYVTYAVLGSKSLALIYFCLICFAQQNFWEHNTLTSHPASIQIGYLLFLLSIPLFKTGYIYNKKNSLWLSALLFGLSLLTYEMMLPFVAIYPLLGLAFWEDIQTTADSRVIPTWLQRISPHLMIFLFIFIGYVLFRKTASIDYPGAVIANQISITKIFDTVWALSTSAIPPRYFFPAERVFIDLHETFEPFQMSVRYLLVNHRPEWIVRSALVALITYIGVSKMRLGRFFARRNVILTAICAAGVFLPNLILSLTPAKQEWVASGVTTYTGSYFSVYPAMMLALAIIALLTRLIGTWAPFLKKAVALATAIICSIVCYMTDVTNHFISKAQTDDYNLWRTVEEFTKSDAFRDIPDNSYVYAPTLWQGGRYWGLFHPSPSMDNYWNRFVQLKSNRVINFFRTWNPDFCSKVNQEKNGQFFYVTFSTSHDKSILTSAPVDLGSSPCHSEKLTSDSIDVLVVSTQTPKGVLFALTPGNSRVDIDIENHKTKNISESINMLPIKSLRRSASKKAQELKITSSGASFNLSQFDIVMEKLNWPLL
jgi:hypothetical protein